MVWIFTTSVVKFLSTQYLDKSHGELELYWDDFVFFKVLVHHFL